MKTMGMPIATPRRTLFSYQAQDGNGGSRSPEVGEESAGAQLLAALTENTKAMQTLLHRMAVTPGPPPAPERDPRRENMHEMAD
jgi:hypothetical protein